MVMPEGTQHNAKYILPFKRGAFESLKAVIPVITVYESSANSFLPTWDSLSFAEY